MEGRLPAHSSNHRQSGSGEGEKRALPASPVLAPQALAYPEAGFGPKPPAPPSPARRKAPLERRKGREGKRNRLRTLQWSERWLSYCVAEPRLLRVDEVPSRLWKYWSMGGKRCQLWIPLPVKRPASSLSRAGKKTVQCARLKSKTLFFKRKLTVVSKQRLCFLTVQNVNNTT